MTIDMLCKVPCDPFLLDEKVFSEKRLYEAKDMFNGGVLNESAMRRSLDLFFKEMDESGVDMVVAPIRSIDRTETAEAKEKYKTMNKNDMLAELCVKHGDRIIGMIGVEPNDDADYSINQIKEYVIEGSVTGVSLEPGRSPIQMDVADERIFPIYEYCQEHKIPIAMSFGGRCMRDLEFINPLSMDEVAKKFPDLHMTLEYGGYPYVSEMCWVAQNRPNIYLAPNLYIEAACGSGYVEATKMWIPNKICFASMYPGASLGRAVSVYKNAGFDEKALPLVMGENAAKALFLN